MVTLPSGRSYLNLYTGAGPGKDEVLLVEQDGAWRSVASELFHPNGMAVTADGGTLIMSETHAARVTSFSIAENGGLSEKRIIAADIPVPDGLCVDAEGAVWVGCLFASEFLRVTQGGEITHRVKVPAPYWALAATFGRADRRTLYLIAADTDPSRAQRHDSRGFLYSLQVEVPGAGWP
jgi:sugar lactone lactonase YvrE